MKEIKIDIEKFNQVYLEINLWQQLRTVNLDFRFTENIEDMVKYVSSFFDISDGDIYTPTRKRHILIPRQIAQTMAYTYSVKHGLGWTYKYVGKFIGNKDHATVIHAMKSVSNIMQYKCMIDNINYTEKAHEIANYLNITPSLIP